VKCADFLFQIQQFQRPWKWYVINFWVHIQLWINIFPNEVKQIRFKSTDDTWTFGCTSVNCNASTYAKYWKICPHHYFGEHWHWFI
jgi:hypothetical protein